MKLTLVSMDTNEAMKLFPRQGFDAKGVAQTLKDRALHVSITELSLVETLAGAAEGQYHRFCRIAEFAEMAGAAHFSIGAGLRAVIDHELTFGDLPAGEKFPRYSAELQAHFFGRLVASQEVFEHWHKAEVMETARWFDPEGWWAKDQAARAAGGQHAEFATPAGAQDWLDQNIPEIPKQLATNWVLELLIKDDAIRARVAREPERCPTIVAMAAATTLNGYGALVGVEKGWSRYGWLAPALNNYTDARIIAEAAYAHVLASNDGGLRRRAECLKMLNLFRAEAVRWSDLLQRQH